jgi:hypothetical protein
MIGIVIVLVSEGVGIHLYLLQKNAYLAWAFALMNLSAVAWLLRDYIAMGKGAISIDDRLIHMRVGRRFAFDVPIDDIDSVSRPGWKDIPQTGMPEASDFINLMSQAMPNVLLKLKEPLTIMLPLKRKKHAGRIALHIDEPDAFMTSVSSRLSDNG